MEMVSSNSVSMGSWYRSDTVKLEKIQFYEK